MGLAQCCDVCGFKFLREISNFCANCGEKRMEQGVLEEEDALVVEEEENMRGPPARVALQEKNVNKLSYLQVFAPPTCRTETKKYGKKALLAAKLGIQHRIMLDNYEQAKKWVVHAQVGRLPSGAFSLEEPGIQDCLREIVKENCSTLQEMKLGRKNHKWGEREIYKYLKQHLRYQRKKKRNLEKLSTNENDEVNELMNTSPVEEDRQFYLTDTVENMEMQETTLQNGEEAHRADPEPVTSIEDNESFLMLVLGLPTVDVMKKHLKKVMENVNGRVSPKPFGKGYRRWDKEKQMEEVAKYYREEAKKK